MEQDVSRDARAEFDSESFDSHPDLRPAWVEIDLDALVHNHAQIVQMVGSETHIIATVKANAYGHGVVRVAQVLSGLGVAALATASYDEAVMIREAGVTTPIVLFPGVPPAGLSRVIDRGFIPTVHDRASAQAVLGAADRPLTTFVEVDAGAGRLGVPLREARDLVLELASSPNITIAGVHAHLSFSDAEGEKWSSLQTGEYRELIRSLEAADCRIALTGALSSSGILTGFDVGGTSVTPGHLLYGISPFARPPEELARFRPVMKAIKSRLLSVSRHSSRRNMGHGGKLTVDSGSVTGVAPVGRSHGFRVAGAGSAEALIRGLRVPVLGLSLEHMLLDLTVLGDAAVGEEVTHLGPAGNDRITLQEVARAQGGTQLDVLMGFGRNLEHVYSGPRATS